MTQLTIDDVALALVRNHPGATVDELGELAGAWSTARSYLTREPRIGWRLLTLRLESFEHLGSRVEQSLHAMNLLTPQHVEIPLGFGPLPCALTHAGLQRLREL